MTKEDLLKENGWTIECESPFEIRHENGSFASMDGAYAVASELQLNSIISRILLFKDAYQSELIDKDKFIDKTIEILDRYYE